jgi:hypothetical protein
MNIDNPAASSKIPFELHHRMRKGRAVNRAHEIQVDAEMLIKQVCLRECGPGKFPSRSIYASVYQGYAA